jgi:hypothetical protein
VNEYFSLQLEMQKFPKISKMNFNGQLNMFFGKIFSCTCNLHLKLVFLNPLNIIFFQMVEILFFFLVAFFFQNLKILKILYNLVLHQVHIVNMYFHRRVHVFLVKKFEINCMTLCIPFDSFKKKLQF